MIAFTNSVVAVFESHDQAEDAIRDLQTDGFDIKKLSLVGKDYQTEGHVIGYYTWVPGIGQLLMAGPLAMWIVGALEEVVVVGGLTALGAGLYSIGIPKNSVVQYENKVKNGKLLLVAHGTPEEVERAQDLLHQTQAQTTTVHAEQVAASV
jgi:hypothetical protein